MAEREMRMQFEMEEARIMLEAEMSEMR